ncbi:hypothetical protein [Streptomyces sp. NPDC058255]|uniref:hypothetical protein n=1 Tax=Streptomyces sp. NPDC058255 TaxID=3346407 RepID=UPI0036E44CE5
MVKHRRRKLDARRRQKWTGESYQTAVRAVSGAPQVSTAESQSALASHYSVNFRDALSEARKAAMTGDIDTVESFARTRLHHSPGTGIEVATSLLLFGTELDRAAESALPGLVRRILRDDALGHPLWRRQVDGKSVLTYDGLFPAGVHEVSRFEPAAELDSRLQDPRVRSLLDALTTEEHATLRAWCGPGVSTWSDAAAIAGSTDPDRSGDQMRRKIRRLVAKLWGTAA